MCGIAGWFGPLAADGTLASSLADALAHRGPDAHATCDLVCGTLVHTRLRIIDLTAAGAQPMSNDDGTVWVAFNGEIYNHHELRRELEGKGVRFRGRSDTEVLPHLYERHGPDFVQRLRGMFSIAVLDTARRRLVLARDRFGIKPLYWGETGQGLAFASELAALRLVPGLDLTVDAQAVHDFVALHVIAAPLTIHRGVHALEPGDVLIADERSDAVGWSIRPYHRWEIAVDEALTIETASDRAANLVDAAVGRQLESDVPLGALLSGGIDSTLLSEAAQRQLGGSLRTFSVGFEDPAFDESPAIAAAVGRLGTAHTSLTFQHDDDPTWDDIEALLLHAGQPFADTSILAVHRLCRLVREHVTVAISGDGGDEAFGGYDHFGRLPLFSAALALPRPIQRAMWMAAAAAARPATKVGLLPSHIGGRLQDAAQATDASSMLADQGSWARERELAHVWRGPAVDPVARLFERQWQHDLPRSASRLERLSAQQTEVDTRVRMANDYLPKVDIASMAVSLEVRVPMLDEDLFRFGLTLPNRLKASRGERKLVLRHLAGRRVPEVARLPKHGFGVPFDTWVGDDFRSRLRDELLAGGSPVEDFLARDSFAPIVAAFCDGRSVEGLTRQGAFQRVFMLVSLLTGLRQARVTG